MRVFAICLLLILAAVLIGEGQKVQREARQISVQERRDHDFKIGYRCTMNALDELGRDADVLDVYDRSFELRKEMWGY